MRKIDAFARMGMRKYICMDYGLVFCSQVRCAQDACMQFFIIAHPDLCATFLKGRFSYLAGLSYLIFFMRGIELTKT